MSKITITINTDNAAFHFPGDAGHWPNPEVGRILQHLGMLFINEMPIDPPRDINGNVVGTVEITE